MVLRSNLKRFIIKPGYVDSINDWQRHWIGPTQLMKFYLVDARECIILDEFHPWTLRGYRPQYLDALLELTPLITGNYRPVSDREREIYPLIDNDGQDGRPTRTYPLPWGDARGYRAMGHERSYADGSR